MSRVFLPQLQETRSRFYQSSPLLTAISSESVQGDGSLGGEDTLAWPEIPGLWKEDYKPFQVAPQTQTQPRLPHPPSPRPDDCWGLGHGCCSAASPDCLPAP